jgi:hypothetical protein
MPAESSGLRNQLPGGIVGWGISRIALVTVGVGRLALADWHQSAHRSAALHIDPDPILRLHCEPIQPIPSGPSLVLPCTAATTSSAPPRRRSPCTRPGRRWSCGWCRGRAIACMMQGCSGRCWMRRILSERGPSSTIDTNSTRAGGWRHTPHAWRDTGACVSTPQADCKCPESS